MKISDILLIVACFFFSETHAQPDFDGLNMDGTNLNRLSDIETFSISPVSLTGGGGQEGKHPVVQDIMLPFTRCLVGPFDYTPLIYTQGKSNAHMLSFFVTYYGSAQTVRGAYVAWHGNGKYGKGGEELEFIKRVPASWDDTKVLTAKIGDYLIVARKSGRSWFLGGMTGEQAFSGKLALDFLDSDKTYTMTTFSDDPNGFTEGWCPTIKKIQKVNCGNALSVDMLSSGGLVAIFDPVD